MPILSSLGALTSPKQIQTLFGGSRYFPGSVLAPSLFPAIFVGGAGNITDTPGYTLEYRVRYNSFYNPAPFLPFTQKIGSFNPGFQFSWAVFIQPDGDGFGNRVGLGRLCLHVNGIAIFTTEPFAQLNRFYAIAITVVNDGTNSIFRFFVDGVRTNTRQFPSGPKSSQTVPSSNLSGGAFRWAPTQRGTPCQELYYDEVRISNIARYTSNYSVSNVQFEDDINTLVLLHFYYDSTKTNLGAPIIDFSSFNNNIGSGLTEQVLTPRVF